MKAEITRNWIEKIVCTFTSWEYANDIINQCDEELKELERLASKQESMLVEDEDGVTFVCPSCYADNSKWIDWSMLQRQPKRAKRCQDCGQLIKWGESNKNLV